MTVKNNYNDLYGVAKSTALSTLGGNIMDDYAAWAEDIAQDVIVELLELEQAGKLNEDTVFGLAKTIAERQSTSLYNKERRRREIEAEHGAAINRELLRSREALAEDPFEQATSEEMADRINNLSEKLYNTANAYYILGLTAAEIAEEDGTTEDVVYKRLQRARDYITGEQEQ